MLIFFCNSLLLVTLNYKVMLKSGGDSGKQTLCGLLQILNVYVRGPSTTCQMASLGAMKEAFLNKITNELDLASCDFFLFPRSK